MSTTTTTTTTTDKTQPDFSWDTTGLNLSLHGQSWRLELSALSPEVKTLAMQLGFETRLRAACAVAKGTIGAADERRRRVNATVQHWSSGGKELAPPRTGGHALLDAARRERQIAALVAKGLPPADLAAAIAAIYAAPKAEDTADDAPDA